MDSISDDNIFSEIVDNWVTITAMPSIAGIEGRKRDAYFIAAVDTFSAAGLSGTESADCNPNTVGFEIETDLIDDHITVSIIRFDASVFVYSQAYSYVLLEDGL